MVRFWVMINTVKSGAGRHSPYYSSQDPPPALGDLCMDQDKVWQLFSGLKQYSPGMVIIYNGGKLNTFFNFISRMKITPTVINFSSLPLLSWMKINFQHLILDVMFLYHQNFPQNFDKTNTKKITINQPSQFIFQTPNILRNTLLQTWDKRQRIDQGVT